MKRSLTALILLSLLAIPGEMFTQEMHSTDWTLSMLRGTWEHHAFMSVTTLSFDSDHRMIVNDNDAEYTLLPGMLSITGEHGTTDYPYTLDDKTLTLHLPDGDNRTYEKISGGRAERSIQSYLVTPTVDENDRAVISFDGKHTFAIYDEFGDDIGVYRVEGDTVLLTLNDTTIYAVDIRGGNSDGSFDFMAFDGKVYMPEPTPPPSTSPAVQISGGEQSEHTESPFLSLLKIITVLIPDHDPPPPPAETIIITPEPSAAPPAPVNNPDTKPRHRNFGSARPTGK